MLEFIFDLIFHLYEPQRIPFPSLCLLLFLTVKAPSSLEDGCPASLLLRVLWSPGRGSRRPRRRVAEPGRSRGPDPPPPLRLRSQPRWAQTGLHPPHGSVLHTSEGWFPPARPPRLRASLSTPCVTPGGDLSAGDTVPLCVSRAAAQASLSCPQPRAPVLLVLERVSFSSPVGGASPELSALPSFRNRTVQVGLASHLSADGAAAS